MAKTGSTAFNTDRSIFKSTLERAKLALGSDYFLVLLTCHDSFEFELYSDDGLSHDTQDRVYHGLSLFPHDRWITTWNDGVAHFYDGGSENRLVAELLGTIGCQNALIAPFFMDDQGFGYACWLWEKPREPGKDDFMKSELIADLIALSVKAYRNKKRARERGDKLAALLKLSTSIYSSLNYTDVLQKAINLSMEIMAADGGAIFILDKDKLLLRPIVIVDERYKEELSSVTLKPGDGITGRVVQAGQGIISNNSDTDPRSVQVPGTPVDKESLISAPLTWSGEVIGAITLWSYSGKSFAKEDLEVLTIFARQTADAIENAKLFESLEKAYEELSATQEQLVMAEKLKALGEMAGGVAHDFNNVLGTILGRTQLLMRKYRDGAISRELGVIEEATLKGRRSVQRLQDFTHVSSRKKHENVDINKTVLDAIDTTGPAWKDTAQKMGVTIKLHKQLGDVAAMEGSHEELKEAVCNVILNSVDALPDGGNIWIKTFMKGDKVVLQISDDGIGMDETVKNKLFLPFFTTKGKKGFGMGLAVVYGILFRHQADIAVESAPGQGAVFTFAFNRSLLRTEENGRMPVPRSSQSLSILVVDDDLGLLAVIGDMIEFLNHKCIKADSGRAAMKLLSQERFDLVITDLGMPEVGGWEVARFCREHSPGTPIILISGWGAQLDNQDALSKVDAVLPKPFQMDELKETIERVTVALSKTEKINIRLT